MLPSDEKSPVPQIPWPSGASAAQPQPGHQLPVSSQEAGFQQGSVAPNPIVANSMPSAHGNGSPQHIDAAGASAHPHQSAARSNESETDDALWAGRVKDIVAQTQHDPYARMQALQQLRALYQRERFGKVIETEDRS